MRCSSCGQENRPRARFCDGCGARLAAPPADEPPAAYTPKDLAEKILTSRAVLEGERTHITVMFADISGFTAMSERLDPGNLRAIYDRALEVIMSAVHQYEGIINNIGIDGIMALFGAPIACDDHAARALRAALDISRELQPVRGEVRRLHGQDFQVRIGINTGLVVVNVIGPDLHMDYTAVGDTVTVARHLLQAAEPGAVLIGEGTNRLAQGVALVERVEPLRVAGRSQAIAAYRVVGIGGPLGPRREPG